MEFKKENKSKSKEKTGKQTNNNNKNKLLNTENKPVVAREEVGGRIVEIDKGD